MSKTCDVIAGPRGHDGYYCQAHHVRTMDERGCRLGYELTHWKAEPGRALCYKGDPYSSPALPGEWLTLVEAEVDCPVCKEWMHA